MVIADAGKRNRRAEALRCRDQNTASLSGSAAGFGAGAGTCWAGALVEARVHHPLRRLALAEEHPAGGDVVEIDDEGRTLDLGVLAVSTAHKPFVSFGIELYERLCDAGTTDIQTHAISPFRLQGSEA